MLKLITVPAPALNRSGVSAAAYNAKTQTLFIRLNGKAYRYGEIELDSAMMGLEKGTFFDDFGSIAGKEFFDAIEPLEVEAAQAKAKAEAKTVVKAKVSSFAASTSSSNAPYVW